VLLISNLHPSFFSSLSSLTLQGKDAKKENEDEGKLICILEYSRSLEGHKASSTALKGSEEL